MNKKTILVFGGNGYIGAETVEYLLDHTSDEYDFVLINRGNWSDWDTETRIKSRIQKTFVCDREKDSLKECLKEYLDMKGSFKFEAIIDFSGYKAKVIRNTLNDIPVDMINLYIYISTDSVYEVSIDKHVNDGEEFFLEETDSIRPQSKEKIQQLKDFDSYAHHKLACEEELINKVPFIFLRLPDVIGPRDSEERFWYYQMWLQYLNSAYSTDTKHNIKIPKFFYNKKTSYVYVKDVAIAVYQALKSNIRNEIFNIGFDESVTLIDVIKLMASLIRPGFENNLDFIQTEDENDCINHPYPSVTKGPVSIQKAKRLLNFNPHEIRQAFQESIDFYYEAYLKYPKMRIRIENEIKKEVLQTPEELNLFTNFIKNY